jgi:hypothetical protein
VLKWQNLQQKQSNIQVDLGKGKVLWLSWINK